MRVLLFAPLLCVSLAGVAQTQPDVAGRWVLIGSSGDPADLAESLDVQATTRTLDVHGRPMAPHVTGFTVRRVIGGATRTETLELAQGGVIEGGGGLPSVTESDLRSFWSVRWADNCLVMFAESASSPGAGAANIVRTFTEQWCMNAAGHLVVAVRRTHSGQADIRAMRVYRRP